jgi:ATP-dependent helicase HrpA
LLQLIKNNLSQQIKYLEQKRFSNFTQTAMYLKNIDNSEKLLTDSINFILRMSVDLTNIPSNNIDFEKLIKIASQTIIQNTTLFANVLFSMGKCYHALSLRLDGHNLESEIEEQLDNLVYSGFLRYTRYSQLEHFPRYLQAIIKRLDKYAIDKSRDSIISKDINELYESWYDYVDKLEQANKIVSREIYDFRYKIEELRVSLFAQELKTQYPVSLKRLWRELESI